MVTEANTQPPAIPITTPAIHALGPGRYCNCRNPSSCLCCTRNSRASLPTPPPSRPHPLLVTVIVLAAGMLRPRDGNLGRRRGRGGGREEGWERGGGEGRDCFATTKPCGVARPPAPTVLLTVQFTSNQK
jgi:hypothetical protein